LKVFDSDEIESVIHFCNRKISDFPHRRVQFNKNMHLVKCSEIFSY